ncbi:MAG: HAMP domain-containing histidine kinase [Planctomycetes bacterium]|nr:HAMP domain-containing histidine kinase [Planctomycetota bacterium]
MNAAKVGDLAGVLGHELRNPLAAAMTAATLLREMIDDGDPRRDLADQVLADLDRITRLTDGWLRLSRAGEVNRRQIDIEGLLDRVAARHEAVVVTGPVAVAVDGDETLLERALDNLLTNAVQAGARHLRIAAQCLDDEVAIHIEDDGAGIAEADRARIFAAGWSGRGGNGLGLHAVEATVRAHRGRIRCVPLRQGTRFTLQLPMSRLQPALA